MVVHGYRMKQLTMNELQEQIDKLHKKYQLQVKKEYGRLLGEEIAFLCDQIALNVVPKPRISIFEQAKQNLNQQLQVAKMNGTKQNLQVVMYVMPEDEYVYLNVKFHNPVFEKIFKHLEPYSLTEEEYADEDNAKRIQWERLNQKALKTPPMGISFFESGNLSTHPVTPVPPAADPSDESDTPDYSLSPGKLHLPQPQPRRRYAGRCRPRTA